MCTYKLLCYVEGIELKFITMCNNLKRRRRAEQSTTFGVVNLNIIQGTHSRLWDYELVTSFYFLRTTSTSEGLFDSWHGRYSYGSSTFYETI